MKDILFAGKTVLDFGTGTGVLAILAEMLGAEKILALDNDEWSVENAIENTVRNDCKNIDVLLGTLDDIKEEKFDIILANINRHILLQYMSQLSARMNHGGIILMSGLLLEDKDIILKAASESLFQFRVLSEENNWIALLFNKISA